MEKVSKSAAKKYIILWLADDGTQINLGSVTTANPKDALFNEVCRMMVVAPFHFSTTEADENNIRKLIKESPRSQREHFYAQVKGQVLSMMEAEYKQESK